MLGRVSDLNNTESKPEESRVRTDILEVEVLPSYFTNKEELKCDWKVEEYTSQYMTIKLDFEQPLLVSSSSGEKDAIKISFRSTDYFYDTDGFPLAKSTMIYKELPP